MRNRMTPLSNEERRALALELAIRQWDADGKIAHPYEAQAVQRANKRVLRASEELHRQKTLQSQIAELKQPEADNA